jgi:6-phosphogluconolactonase (cycloisomerase 2 family)
MLRTTFDPPASSRHLALAVLIITCVQLTGCDGASNQSGDGGTSGADLANGHTIGGSVTGLTGAGLILQDNDSYLEVAQSGTFTFPQGIATGATYAVTVWTQPSNPAQACSVSNGSGSVGSTDVTNVAVACDTRSLVVSGTIVGLAGSGLVLQTNGINVPASGNSFAVTLPSGTAYSIVVSSQPTNPSQDCVVTDGTGLLANANVGGVTVTCTDNMVSVGGTITGLMGSGLVLQTNDVNVPISGNTFSVYLIRGSTYNIVPTMQPTTPTQSCTVGNGSGTAVANVSNVTVNCVTQTFTLSGSISNLQGTGIVLQNNGTVVPLSGNSFSLSLASGSEYDIVVAHQPTNVSQTCTASNGGPGTIGSANVVVPIVCVTNTYTLSVDVNGLQNGATGLAVLDNGVGNLPVSGNGTVTFATAVPSGQPYAVTVGTQPTGTMLAQYCLLPDGTGTVTNANVSVTLSCRNVGQALFAVNTWTDPRNNNPGDISAYTINPDTGNLTSAPGAPFAAGTVPFAISLDTQNQILYAINNISNDISTFSVSPTTGVLTGLHTAPGYPTSGAFGGGFSVLVNPQAPDFVYAGSDQAPDGLVDLFTASAGGVLSAPDPTAAGNDPEYMALNPSGTLLFVPEVFDNDIIVYSIGVNGVLTPVPGSPFPYSLPGGNSGPAAIAVSPTASYLYIAGLFNATVTPYSYDDSGTLTPLGPPYTFGTGAGTGVIPPGDGLAIDPTGRFVYVTSPVDNTITEYAISAQTGLLTPVGTPVATGAGPSDVKIEPSGHYLYVSNYTDGTISEYVIDPSTGILTEDHSSPFQSGIGVQSIAIE